MQSSFLYFSHIIYSNLSRKSYKFLKGVKEKELVTLKDQLKEAKSEDRANLKYLIQRTENQLRKKCATNI